MTDLDALERRPTLTFTAAEWQEPGDSVVITAEERDALTAELRAAREWVASRERWVAARGSRDAARIAEATIDEGKKADALRAALAKIDRLTGERQ